MDVLIEFEGNQALFDRYFELKFGLESIFGRKVDVIQNGAVKNPHVRASLEPDRIAIYEA
jgi:predicted nucleotidyltransferase